MALTARGQFVAPHLVPLCEFPGREHATAERDELVDALEAVLQRVPPQLAARSGDSRPQLAAVERESGREVARQLMVIGALIHADADERRTAEYLLRHRHELALGIRSARKLISAARTAAELDCRRIQLVEVPSGSREDVGMQPRDLPASDAPAVGESVIGYLRRAISPRPLPALIAALLADAVPISLELAERHQRNGGTGPALVAMRSDARATSRLATYLRAATGAHPSARSLARLLVGPDASPPETALLWWVAQGPDSHARRPHAITARWARDLVRIEACTAKPTLGSQIHLLSGVSA